MKQVISILYGSVRTARMGIKVAQYLKQEVEKRGHKVHLIDPLEYPLPMLDRMYKEYDEGEAPENMEKVAQMLRESDGFLLVTGEYNHSIPPALKNLLDHYQKEYHFKPSGIAAYSAGSFGGMRAAVHLRVIMGELGAPSIPSLLPFPKIRQLFDEHGQPTNDITPKSTQRFLDEFEWYIQALKAQREQGTPY
jgi:NAD(P)H-dependent FMN reductase